MGEERVERPGDRAHRVLVEGDPLGEVEVAHDERAADDVGVAADVLGRRVDDDVGAERQRLLEVGRGEGVVDDEQRARVVGDGGERLDVGDVEHRVGRRLDPHQLRLARADRGADRVDVGDRRRAVRRAPTPSRPCRRAGRCRRRRRRGCTTWSPGVHSAPDEGVLGGQAGGEREAALPVLDRRQRALERGAGRVGGAAVLVAAAQPAHAVLLVGRRREDRRDHRAGGRVRLVARMDGAGLEAGLVGMLLAHVADPTQRAGWHGPGRLGGRGVVGHDWRHHSTASRRGAPMFGLSKKTEMVTAEQALPRPRRAAVAAGRARRAEDAGGHRRGPRRATRSRSSASAASGARRRSTGSSRASGRRRSATPAATARTRRTRRSARAAPATPRRSGSSSTRPSSRTPTW